MRRRSFLAGLLAVPVAVACDPRGVSQVPVSPGSSGGTTVADLATLEDWHYVGEDGEPAFENGWANAGLVPVLPLAFRIREAGIVDIHGKVEDGSAGTTVFTLPEGYRPSSTSWAVVYGGTGSGPVVSMAYITTAGALRFQSTPSNPISAFMAAQFFLDPPDPSAIS